MLSLQETNNIVTTMSTTRSNNPVQLSRRSTLDLTDQSTFEMNEFIAARDEREAKAIAEERALIEKGLVSVAYEHYNRVATFNAFDQLLMVATDRATTRVIDEMAANGRLATA